MNPIPSPDWIRFRWVSGSGFEIRILETSWSSSHIPPCVQVHGELVVSEGELVEPLTSLLVDLETSWSSLQSDLDTTLCLTNFCKSSFL